MTFTTKTWQDSPSTSTPISAAALIDLETRLSGYTDSSGGTVTLAKIAAAMPYVVDLPENHGAVRDGSTNDTAAIQAAINAAVTAGVANGTNYAEVWFSAGIYQVTSAVTGHGSTTFANSQITLPFITSGSSVQKFTLVLRGVSGAGVALPHWAQTVGQKSGAVLRTTITGTNDVTWGPASVIGGPTNIQGYGGGTGNSWSNMLIIIDGVTIASSTANPTMCGFNFEGLLEAKVISGGYIADATPSTMNGFISSPATFTNQWVFGLLMPSTNNNDLCIVDDWSAEGVWYGIVLAEHSHVRDMRSVYCGWGISLDNRVSTPHIARIDYASVEVCQNAMGLYGGTANFKIDIDLIDEEAAGFIWDGNSTIQGTVLIGSNETPVKGSLTSGMLASAWIGGWNTTPTNGSQMRLICRDVIPGAVQGSMPTVPATTVAYYNPFARDAVVIITGGTVTVIAVDGLTTGLTAGTIVVPAGKPITLTYSAAPSWKWVLL